MHWKNYMNIFLYVNHLLCPAFNVGFSMAFNVRTVWVAAAAAAICIINLVWFCRRTRKKVKVEIPTTVKEPLLSDELAFSSAVNQDEALEGDNGVDLRAGSHDIVSDVAADDRSDIAFSALEANVAAVQPQPLPQCAHLHVTPQPVDTEFLQVLLDTELGPPKFSVPKKEESSSSSLKALLDKEFGPPKFVIQKPITTADEGADSSLKEAQEDHPESSIHRPSLQLEVISGPAKGKMLIVGNDDVEVVIGRLPTCLLPIMDQEISSRHAVISYDDQAECWQLMDAGSLNGTNLNGKSVSSNDRKPGPRHSLSNGDLLQLGEVTRVKVSIEDVMAEPMAKRKTPSATWGPRGIKHSGSSHTSSLQSYTVTKLPPLQTVQEFPSQGLRLAVHQRLGTEHMRHGKDMEDVVLHMCPFDSLGSEAALFCIFDGHSGIQAALHAKSLVPDLLARKFQDPVSGAIITGRTQDEQAQALKEVFLDADSSITSDDGCTATVVLMQKQPESHFLIQAANVGDSSAIAVDVTSGSWTQLTADHRIANSYAERERLQERGLTVKRRLYGLNISRMLGDRFLKEEDLGFIAEPHVSLVTEFPSTHVGFLIVASDGLWDVLSEERAASLVIKAYSEDPSSTNAELIADILLNQALTLRSQDDISILVVEKRSVL
ncbi:hypothetical protein CEUSTIGMA_g10820.t1 [Chlamydomonas eustigma]|uniref:Protein-serine/threonine phosphatase n=1 Tax=Chlamydomonas eustigma TaxID=1157962 RepID=A0A250XJY4_9CHLO|nr:hypothetical protein CEUSTIGMA_g10820.t1 [Chlamydomonas eustigma]|eukprot:GAX83395.1 hypothetical protein CEUSTIGMA_g10820.t1 [Chlamydomonas eustigma]